VPSLELSIQRDERALTIKANPSRDRHAKSTGLHEPTSRPQGMSPATDGKGASIMAASWGNVSSQPRRWLGALIAVLVTIAIAITAAEPADAADCNKGELQSLVDDATAGETVKVPTCIYREKVTVSKPLILDGQGAAEIRGSNVWASWTKKSGPVWVSSQSVPVLPLPLEYHCETTTEKCKWPEQVFVNGVAQTQVPPSATPKSGQFNIKSARNVTLGTDPTGKTVEVTERPEWLEARASGITVKGFTMKHAGNRPQTGAIYAEGYNDFVVENSHLMDTHGAVVSFIDVLRGKLLDSEVARGGQLGLHNSKGTLELRGNEIHHNNTENYLDSWEAGGAKFAGILRSGTTHSVLADANHIYANKGKGMWSDVDARNITLTNNRVHHNVRSGIQLEITDGGKISGNVVWENGWGKTGWGWGAGILLSSSKNVEIYDNVVAWNGDGISVISADRNGTSHDDVVNVRVHHNSILHKDYPTTHFNSKNNFALAWLQDWSGVLFAPASKNLGYDNKYWYATSEGAVSPYLSRYAWDGNKIKLIPFNETPGEEQGRYLTNAEKDQVVSSAKIPSSPETH
jgi:parallel beta-helix repeat protein